MLKRFVFFSTLLHFLVLLVFTQCMNQQPGNKPKTPTTPTTVAVDTAVQWFCSTIEVQDDPNVPRAVGSRGKFWPVGKVFKIAFLDGTPAQIEAVKTHAPEWFLSANLGVEWVTNPSQADVRISFDASQGAWSYVGTDNKGVKTGKTMNLGWQAPDAIKHEFGHLLGLYHEHQNPQGGICWNEQVVIKDLQGPPNYWSVAQIRFNVLDPINSTDLVTTPWDRTSIMHYGIPGSWVCNGTAIPGGKTISATDKAFIAMVYPGKVPPTDHGATLTAAQVNTIIQTLDARRIEADTLAARSLRSRQSIGKLLGK